MPGSILIALLPMPARLEPAITSLINLPDAVHRIGNALWLDPGDPAVREHVVNVVRDIVERYPVAGVILDDYFYPYPSRSYRNGSFPDHAFYERYGGNSDLGNWRRQNVNKLIKTLHETVKNGTTRPAFWRESFRNLQERFPIQRDALNSISTGISTRTRSPG